LAAVKSKELDCCGADAFCAACYEDVFAAEGWVDGVLGCHGGGRLGYVVCYEWWY
jgi:hypothetical protein